MSLHVTLARYGCPLPYGWQSWPFRTGPRLGLLGSRVPSSSPCLQIRIRNSSWLKFVFRLGPANCDWTVDAYVLPSLPSYSLSINSDIIGVLWVGVPLARLSWVCGQCTALICGFACGVQRRLAIACIRLRWVILRYKTKQRERVIYICYVKTVSQASESQVGRWGVSIYI